MIFSEPFELVVDMILHASDASGSTKVKDILDVDTVL